MFNPFTKTVEQPGPVYPQDSVINTLGSNIAQPVLDAVVKHPGRDTQSKLASSFFFQTN